MLETSKRPSNYGGADVYIEDPDEPEAESVLESLLAGMDLFDEELFEDEKRGPPDIDELTLQA